MTNSLRTSQPAVAQSMRRQLPSARAGKNSTLIAGAILLQIAALPIFLGKALSIYSESQRILAWMIFALSTVPFFIAASRKVRQVPLTLLVAAQYAVFFAFPVFFEDSMTTRMGNILPDAAAIDMTLLCAILSLIAIGLGYTFSGTLFRRRYAMFRFSPSSDRLFWFGTVSLLGSVALLVGQGTLFGWTPGDLTQPLKFVLSADLGIAILACLYFQGTLKRWQKWIAVSLLVLAVAIGVASGMFQSAVQPALIWVICRWILKGKVPVVTLVIATAAFFAFQPVKASYRNIVWMSGRSFTSTEKLIVYGDLLKQQWLGNRLSSGKTVELGKTSARNRLSLLLSTAHYVEWTPNPIEYKNGSTLAFLAYGWIPRAIWPGKPIAQEANKILPDQYYVQSAETQNQTMFGVGHLAEAYVNFGLAGIFPLFFALGILYRLPHVMLERERSVVTIALFVAVMVAIVPIGSSISNAFGGFLQQIFVQGTLLRLLTREKRKTVQARIPRVRLDAVTNSAPGIALSDATFRRKLS